MNDLDRNIIENYVEKVYGFAVNNTYSRDEADELAQEILFTAVRELPNLRDESKFEPWLWGIANNLTKRFRYQCGKRRAFSTYDTIEDPLSADTYLEEQEELYDVLRTKITMLSAIYRETIVMHYYDGLTTKEIAETLHIPESTVRWRLSEARKKLKKGGMDVNETLLRPVEIRIRIYGTGDYNGKNFPFPMVYVEDALSQNILYYSYEEPKGVEDLATNCGIPAYFIEDRIRALLNRNAIIEVTKGKYQTDLVIFSDKHSDYYEENAAQTLMPVMERLLDALDNIAKDAAGIGFYRAGRSETDLFHLYGALAFTFVTKHYCSLPYPQIPKNYDGYRWRYVAYTKPMRSLAQMCINTQYNNIGRGNSDYVIYFSKKNGMNFRKMMDRKHINVCEDLLFDGKTEDVDSAAEAIRIGYVERQEDGCFFVKIPFFTKDQKAAFDAIVERHLAPLMPEYAALVNRFVAGYKRLFPKHLQDDVDRFCASLFYEFFGVVAEYAQKTGRIALPSPNYYCDAFIQFQERTKTVSERN